MRRLLLLLAVAGCAASSPGSAGISVNVRDENGSPVARTQVRVSLPSGIADRGTDDNGNVTVDVPSSGSYRVQVIPREGYVSSANLTKDVTVYEMERATVDFTMHRAGVSTAEPIGYYWPTPP
jgi:hypothetical protein